MGVVSSISSRNKNRKVLHPPFERRLEIMRKYKPATFQPTIRPDWGGVLPYLAEKEKSQILEAIIKYPSVECDGAFWQETIKPDLDLQYQEFCQQCEAKSRGVRNRWGKTSITPLIDENNTSNTDVIVAEGIGIEEGEDERESEKEKESKYAFEGKVIKLTHKDYENWQKAYPDLNLYAECLVRDEWLSKQPDTKNWFISTAKYFVKQNEERKKQHKAQDDEEESFNDWLKRSI